MFVSKKHSTLENTRSLQVASWVLLKCVTASVLQKLQYVLNSNICQIYRIKAIHGWNCSSKTNTVFTEEWMSTTTFVKLRNTALWKKLLPAIKHSKLQIKNVFKYKYFGLQSFLWAVFSLIGIQQVFTCAKSIAETRKSCETCSALTVKTIEEDFKKVLFRDGWTNYALIIKIDQ